MPAAASSPAADAPLPAARPTPLRRALRWAERAAWLALLAFAAHRLWPQAAATLGVAAGHDAVPDFTLATLDGAPVSRDALRGKVVLVNFWATWCPPCRVEMPGFQRVHARHAADGLVILGVATDDAGADHVREWLRTRGITYPVAMATPEIVRAFGGVRGLPTSFLLDRDGRILYRVVGIFTEPALERAVSRLLAAPAAPSTTR